MNELLRVDDNLPDNGDVIPLGVLSDPVLYTCWMDVFRYYYLCPKAVII